MGFCYGLAKMLKCSGGIICKSIYIFSSYCQLIDFLAWGSCSIKALLPSLTVRLKALNIFIVPVSFHFQCIKTPLHSYGGPLAGED